MASSKKIRPDIGPECRCIGRRLTLLDEICRDLRVKELSTFVSGDHRGSEAEVFEREWPEEDREQWYDPKEAIQSITAILDRWDAYPSEDWSRNYMQQGLSETQRILEDAALGRIHFHLSIRF